ncbi:MAG: acetaldehyde dehydrogenase (acetylating) [Synergistaceae bacterium]|nr:acetaldehyde dehydrogenase (acetylating) [Synergistaceae bacterium]
MQLLDKDLLSMQEVRALIATSKKAQSEFATKDHAYIDRIIKSIANAGVRNAERLGIMATEDTGFGIPADKTIKNVFGSRITYEYIKDMKTTGVIEQDDKLGITTLAVPMGVIAGIIPSTNPTSTTLNNAIIALKGGNSIVFSPHPQALRCILETVRVIRQAIAEAGGNPDLVSIITIPTRQATEVLMSHHDTALVIATGGSAMVRAAYSSGTPAIGVGPGNGPAYIDKSADIPLAVKRIMDSKTFDNGTICSSEQSVACVCSIAAEVEAEMKRQGAYFLSDEEKDQLGKFILRANGTMNPEIVGKNAQVVAQLANLPNVPATARVLVAREDGVGRGHPYSNEKLSTILAFYTAETFEEVCDICCDILNYEGAGHTMSMHTKDLDKVNYFAKRAPVSRLVVNTPATFGGIGASTGLVPAMTLGCGAIGGSATSDNVGPMNLINKCRIAVGKKEIEEIRASAPTCTDGICEASSTTSCSVSDVDVDEIVRKILEKLKQA